SAHAVAKVAEAKELDPVERERLKTGLDDVMSISLENGVWSWGAGLRARGILGHLSPAGAAEWEHLLPTREGRGDVQVDPGEWAPGSRNGWEGGWEPEEMIAKPPKTTGGVRRTRKRPWPLPAARVLIGGRALANFGPTGDPGMRH